MTELKPGMHIRTPRGWHFVVDRVEDGFAYGTVQGDEAAKQWAKNADALGNEPSYLGPAEQLAQYVTQ